MFHVFHMLHLLRVGICIVLLSLNFGVQAAFCNDIHEDSNRLACFDRLAACRSVSGIDARLGCYDRVVATSKAVSPRSTAPALTSMIVNPVVVNESSPQMTEVTTVRNDDKAAAIDFGLPAKKPETPDQISTRIKGIFDGFQGKQKFVLENGQIWQMRRNMGIRKYSAIENPEVTISTNLLGFYVMAISGVRVKLPVKRRK